MSLIQPDLSTLRPETPLLERRIYPDRISSHEGTGTPQSAQPNQSEPRADPVTPFQLSQVHESQSPLIPKCLRFTVLSCLNLFVSPFHRSQCHDSSFSPIYTPFFAIYYLYILTQCLDSWYTRVVVTLDHHSCVGTVARIPFRANFSCILDAAHRFVLNWWHQVVMYCHFLEAIPNRNVLRFNIGQKSWPSNTPWRR